MKHKKAIFGVLTILIAGSLIASAGLLSYYGKVETTATVAQSVVIDGQEDNTAIEHSFDITAGCAKWAKHKISNRACVEAPIDILTDINGYGKGPAGVDVDYYTLPGWITLRLENKDSAWDIIDDEFYADVTFNPVCPTFNGDIVGKFAPDTEYVLIYYMDQPDRFVNWGGAPALSIITFITDGEGVFDFDFDVEIDPAETTIPYAADWNIGPDAEYDVSDGYTHGKGAKLWLVPSAIYNGLETELGAWVPDEILFETDLILYADCDYPLPTPEVLCAYFEYENEMNPTQVTLASGEELSLFIRYWFDVAIMPGDYGITTTVVPYSPQP